MIDFDTVDYQVYFINSPHIWRVNLDGSGKKIVAENVLPQDIAIDWIGRRVFWTTLHQNDIQTINLDGSEKRVFVSTKILACYYSTGSHCRVGINHFYIFSKRGRGEGENQWSQAHGIVMCGSAKWIKGLYSLICLEFAGLALLENC